MSALPKSLRRAVREQHCLSKEPHPTRRAARAAVRDHDCIRCIHGAVFNEYRCQHDPSHWHVGHLWRQP